MHQDVSKILRCSVDVSFDGVPSGDEGVTLSCVCCDVCVDGCLCSSCWLSSCYRLIPLSMFLVECSQSFLMLSDAAVDGLSVVSPTIHVVAGDRMSLGESRVEVGHEPDVVELKKASDL